jgi:hypothetical protein
MLRVSERNRWREATWEEVRDVSYGRPFSSANAIVVTGAD